MKTFVLLALAIPAMSFAQNRDQLERNLLSTLNNTKNAINYNLQRMTETELMRAQKMLEKVEELANGGGTGPLPPVRINCAQDLDVNAYQAAFRTIKDFAYSAAGFNYGSQTASDFAQDWLKKHPCNRAASYTQDAKRLKDFAYSGSGLNYGSQTAIDFAIAKVDRFCAQFELEAQFRKQYDFAYSGTGLNYGSQQARDYALAKIEPFAFSCVNL